MTKPSMSPAASVFSPAPVLRRLGAASVDLAVLWFVGELLAALFHDEFIAMGRKGRLIGALFFLAYLGGQNSTLNQGRTLGKRLFRLRTLHRSGGYLSLERSMARAFLLLLPFLFRNVFFFPDSLPLALALNGFAGALSWGWGGAVLLSILGSRWSGQALHDQFAGSMVVRAVPSDSQEVQETRSRKRRALLALWLAASAVTGGFLAYTWGGGVHWAAVVRAQRAVAAMDDITRAEVYRGAFYWRRSEGGITSTQFVQASAFFRGAVEDPEHTARAVAERVLAELGAEVDALRVTVAWEFDLLVARRRWEYSFVRRPADWLASGTMAARPAALPERAVQDSTP